MCFFFPTSLVFVSRAPRHTVRRSIEQRFAIEFCPKLGKSPVKTFRMIKTAFDDDSLLERQVFRWHKAFLESV